MKERFTTTLNSESKKRLAVLSANAGIDRNTMIEQMITKEWENFINEMDNERDSRGTTE